MLRAQSSGSDFSTDVLSRLPLAVGAAIALAIVVAFAAPIYVIAAAAWESSTWSDVARVALLAAAAVGIFRAAAAWSVIDQPQVPPLVGCSAVGSRVIDIPATGGRARCFYPAEPGHAEAPYLSSGRDSSDGMASLVGFRQVGCGFLLEHLAEAASGCGEDAPPSAAGRFPLLVYSHGYGGSMDMSCFFLRGLAAQGVVVVALEHTDGTASYTVCKDEPLCFAPFSMSPTEQQSRRALELLSAAAALPQELADVVDRDAVFFGGHSYGGPSAVTAGLIAERRGASIGGVLLHDPAIALVGVNQLPKAPTLTFTSEEYDANGVRAGTTFACRGAMHGNFVDAPLWAPLWVMRPLSLLIPAAGAAEPRGLHLALARAAAGFMREPAADPSQAVSDAGPGVFVQRAGPLSGGQSLS